jgi:D-aspartate ligase
LKPSELPVPTPYILGARANGYSIARAFYETYGVKSLLFDYHSSVARYSSFCRFVRTVDPKQSPEAFIERLLSERRHDPTEGAVVLPTNDEWLLPVADSQARLEEVFFVPSSSNPLIRNLATKSSLYRIARDAQVPFPETVVLSCGAQQVSPAIESLRYPAICKPVNVPDFIRAVPHVPRNQISNDAGEVNSYLMMLARRGYFGEMIVQEYVPGPVSALYTATTYSDRNGKVRAVSVGHKLTQNPPSAGTITSGRTISEKRVVVYARKLLESVRFFGVANTEFKFDSEREEFMLMEVNPRFGMWNYSAHVSGANLVSYVVRDGCLGLPVEDTIAAREIVWHVIRRRAVLVGVGAELRSWLLSHPDVQWTNPMANQAEGIRYKLGRIVHIGRDSAGRVAKRIVAAFRSGDRAKL